MPFNSNIKYKTMLYNGDYMHYYLVLSWKPNSEGGIEQIIQMNNKN